MLVWVDEFFEKEESGYPFAGDLSSHLWQIFKIPWSTLINQVWVLLMLFEKLFKIASALCVRYDLKS